MLEVKGLSATYGKHRALDGASLQVAPGEIAVILGTNGAGKSTLLKSIAGICEGRVSGSVTMSGEPLLGLPPHKVVERGVALVPEGRGIFGDLSVRDNLMLGANPERAREDQAQAYDRLISLFPKLEERANQIARTMSGGEQQMVAIGRAMMSNPVILMLDEPSLGLSPLLSKELFQNLKAVRAAGLGILLVEQNARLSLGIADRGYLLENGEILREDRAEVLRNDPAVQAAYLGGSGTKNRPTPAAVPRPAPVIPRGKSNSSISAAAISGVDMTALLARASARPIRRPAPRTITLEGPARASPARALTQNDRLRTALAQIEDAARQARAPARPGPAHAALPPLRPSIRDRASASGSARMEAVAPPSPAPAQPGKVQVWRRRPGSAEFDKEM
ncbi:MAG: ABC transporter ATP-binding protein [Rhodobacteraceae bacterium]|nr:MAG: ABC transporter ATP-binding protein [Paracoccaceae bacterium]